MSFSYASALRSKPAPVVMAAPAPVVMAAPAPVVRPGTAAAVAAAMAPEKLVKPLAEELDVILQTMKKHVPKGSDALTRIVENLRGEMEAVMNGGGASGGAVQFRTGPGQGQGQGQGQSRYGGGGGGGISSWRSGPQPQKKPFDGPPRQKKYDPSGPGPVRYQSKFVVKGTIDDKILNVVIGNKLNDFVEDSYNDTRDFIYQILDSGETEFIRDFVEKVFTKAVAEELFCGLFAKLIAEIAKKYPSIYEEMNKYHGEFIKIFDDIQEGDKSPEAFKKRQYRMGYGLFLAELARRDALEKKDLVEMSASIMKRILDLTAKEGFVNTVEEFVDCLTQLTEKLQEQSPKFFETVKKDMAAKLLVDASSLIDRKSGARPSLSEIARYRLMDFRDLIN